MTQPAANPIVLLNAVSVAEALPDRWWAPSPHGLDGLVPGRCDVKVLAVERDAEEGADLWSARQVWVSVEERDALSVAGRVTTSRVDREGYRPGQRLSAPLDRVFDFVHYDDAGQPILNEERARFALGKRLLVGLTVLSRDAGPIEQRQYVGTLTAVDPHRGLQLTLDDGTTSWLPPDARSLEEAPPGEYRLRSTGEVVGDPDYLCSWTITRSDHPAGLPPTGFDPAP